MKKFILKQKAIEKAIGEFYSKTAAANAMKVRITLYNDDLDSDDDGVLTPFDFTLEETETKDINEEVTDYASAVQYLNKTAGACGCKVQHETLLKELNPHHVKALVALNKLFTIAQAWNKADRFTPDFSNEDQYKYYPWLVYYKDCARFVCAYTNNATAAVPFGSRLCFKTSEHARQFGEQFIDLWNDVLLFR